MFAILVHCRSAGAWSGIIAAAAILVACQAVLGAKPDAGTGKQEDRLRSPSADRTAVDPVKLIDDQLQNSLQLFLVAVAKQRDGGQGNTFPSLLLELGGQLRFFWEQAERCPPHN